MELRHPDIRRYAIDNRIEIKIVDSTTGQACVFNNRGQMGIPGENKDVALEALLSAADRFEIVAEGKTRVLTRAQLAEAISEAFKKRGFAAAISHDED